MKVIGKGSVHIYGAQDERPHEPGSEESWQESVVIYFWDTENKVYSFIRMSQEPNRGSGYMTMWMNVWAPEHVYRHVNDSVPLVSGDRTQNALSAGGGHCRYEYDDQHHFSINDMHTGLRLQLDMRDYHPGIGPYADDLGSLVREANRSHIEATGWATGYLEIGGCRLDIAGTAWRDHSLGPRSWTNIRVHHFYPALFGRDLNFFGITFVGGDGILAKVGALLRNDTVEMTNDFEIVAFMNADGVSNCGGRVSLTLDGRRRVIDFAPQTECNVSLHRDFVCADTLCTVTLDGRKGVGVSETSTRPQGGTARPHIFPPAIWQNGLYSRIRRGPDFD